MLRWLYDLLFTRSEWKIIEKREMCNEEGHTLGSKYVLQDQWGNIKTKKTY